MRDMGLTVSYIWSRGVQIIGVRDLNFPQLSNTTMTYTIADANSNPTGQTYTTRLYLGGRPDTRYGGIYQAENGVNSYYNALAVQLRKRFSHGFQADLSYTWAHEIDDGQSNGSGALFFTSASNWTYNGDYKQDKGNGALDQRHRLVFSFLWQPTVTHRTDVFSKYLLNNWQLSAITTMASGRPVVPVVFISDTTPFAGAAFTTSLNGYGGWTRVPFIGTDTMYSPAAYRVDARISKMLPFTERVRGYLNFEAFNVTNTIVDTSLFTQAYSERGGVLSPTANLGQGNGSGGFPDGTNARRAQVSARLVF